jgi:enamine deaminase RidA (YjgF/YER057c/UK114 family)
MPVKKIAEDRLAGNGITLPAVTAPVANYVPAVISGNTLYISGQLPVLDGVMTKGHLGKDVTIEQGYAAARVCALNIIAQARAALGGDLDRVRRCVKISGFVASVPEFTDHPKVINGASDLIVAAFGEAGKHARAAVGVAALPLGAAVEVEAVFEVEA